MNLKSHNADNRQLELLKIGYYEGHNNTNTLIYLCLNQTFYLNL